MYNGRSQALDGWWWVSRVTQVEGLGFRWMVGGVSCVSQDLQWITIREILLQEIWLTGFFRSSRSDREPHTLALLPGVFGRGKGGAVGLIDELKETLTHFSLLLLD